MVVLGVNMKNSPEYKKTHPHLIESERIALACDYIVHEFRKIFRGTTREEVSKAIKNIAPTEESGDVSIRNFWNLFCSMSSGWCLKELHTIVTAENIKWKKEKKSMESLVPQTPQGWMQKIIPYSFREAVAYLQNNKEERKKALEKSGEIRDSRAEGDENDAIIAIKKNSIFEVVDGNSRLMRRIENCVNERKGSSPPMITVWVGVPNGNPKNFWIPTSSLMFMGKYFNVESKLKEISQLALIEYSKRVKNIE